ncbi:LysR family transcriptional regulator [Croceicoccus sp. F390]|uniref:LysR family transcriptional regulator n=1 Tax=Croceicoccus esteveae TaxID=3075597 RepID=A0ABU2ZF02_9SPHN|nr:LysR family transcriptional regulator [Croceicoccus sp. F390]MDT0575183.1 LysR family transcriptional regulator [Croceicoccus sp. F390]
MDWDDLRVFLAAVRAGDFTGAASRLNIDRTTVGRRLQRLEAKLGIDLWERDRRGALPTAAGRRLLATAEQMEQAIHTFAQALPNQARTRPLRLASALGLAQLVMEEIGEAQGSLPLIIELSAVRDPVDALLHRHADLGLALVSNPSRDLAGIRIGTVAMGFYAVRDDVTRRVGWSRAALAEQPSAWARVNNIEDDRLACEVDNHAAQRDAMLAGMGAAWSWRFLAQREKTLREVPPPENERPPANASLWLLHRPAAGIDPATRDFADRLAELLASRICAE